MLFTRGFLRFTQFLDQRRESLNEYGRRKRRRNESCDNNSLQGYQQWNNFTRKIDCTSSVLSTNNKLLCYFSIPRVEKKSRRSKL
mmetsp:Transcript_6424/g.7354  ORF Transcript_6424/g.7354 Transcript_6424/m.7354 type:complete len:85 (+) Transcript_6424:481-735(+)